MVEGIVVDVINNWRDSGKIAAMEVIADYEV
jgi:hypothetical protein